MSPNQIVAPNKMKKSQSKPSASTRKKTAPITVSKKKAAAAQRQPRIMEAMNNAAVSAAAKKKAACAAAMEIPCWLRESSDIPAHAVRQPRRATPNQSNCYHCPATHCECTRIERILEKAYAACTRQRIAEFGAKRERCAKSVLPNFVTRMISLLDIKANDTFVDLGCGNGSVLYQVALLVPGVRCIGVEIEEHNAAVAREGWARAKKLFLDSSRGSATSSSLSSEIRDVEIITGPLQDVILSSDFAKASRDGRMAIWVSNKLFPGGLNQFIGDRFRRLPPGCRILCMEDLYPHQRAVAALRDPQAFQLFEMTDFCWPHGAVEWCNAEGSIFRHIRTQHEHPEGSITE